MKALGRKPDRARLERIKASPAWAGDRFRNLHPIMPGLRDPNASMPKLSDFLRGGERRVPRGPLPSMNPLDTWTQPPASGLRATWLGPFDIVMLEVGAFHPAWGDIHLGPENALKALALLGGGTFLPVHWGTFSRARARRTRRASVARGGYREGTAQARTVGRDHIAEGDAVAD